MKTVAYLQKGTDKKKYKVTLIKSDGTKKTIQFGASGYKDFTLHDKNVRDDKKNRYLKSHKPRENWNKSGIKTAGFWSRWLLWNKSTISASIKDIEKRFDIKIVKGKPKSVKKSPRKSPTKSKRKSPKKKCRSGLVRDKNTGRCRKSRRKRK
tara:strand:- start:382 stop:837 length:456 start_codon:yes stop_codon:yes gene_type:complete